MNLLDRIISGSESADQFNLTAGNENVRLRGRRKY